MREVVVVVLSCSLAWLSVAEAKHGKQASAPVRARSLGIPFDGKPGRYNAITDVPGVCVGHSTVKTGKGANAVRTGVTAILPRGKKYEPVLANYYIQNGEGEMYGAHHIQSTGSMDTPICLTDTLNMPTVAKTVLRWLRDNRLYNTKNPDPLEACPVVFETWSGDLSRMHEDDVKPRHVIAALEGAKSGPVAEGSVGGGTGMRAFKFKTGIGTSSRVLPKEDGGYKVGVLVQTNFGTRCNLTVAGAPVGEKLQNVLQPILHEKPVRTIHNDDQGSCAVVIATNAPLQHSQLEDLAKHAAMGMTRTGNTAHWDSGEFFLAFSTANRRLAVATRKVKIDALPPCKLDAVNLAAIEATEEAIINSLVAGKTMTGVNGNTVFAIPHDKLQQALAKYNRLKKVPAKKSR